MVFNKNPMEMCNWDFVFLVVFLFSLTPFCTYCCYWILEHWDIFISWKINDGDGKLMGFASRSEYMCMEREGKQWDGPLIYQSTSGDFSLDRNNLQYLIAYITLHDLCYCIPVLLALLLKEKEYQEEFYYLSGGKISAKCPMRKISVVFLFLFWFRILQIKSGFKKRRKKRKKKHCNQA